MSEQKLCRLVGTEEQCDPQSKEQNSCSRTLQEANGSGSRISGNRSLHRGETKNSKGQAGASEENRAIRNPKVCHGGLAVI